MNRRAYVSIIGLALVFLAFGFLTGCSNSSSPPPPPTILIAPVAADATQSTMVGTAFANPLGVTVTSNGSPDSGVTVTYAATTSSGGATCALSATTAPTDSTGSVSSVTCTANGTAGSYTVTATVTGATSPATFNLTNNAAAAPATAVFYVSGSEAINGGPNYYAIVGAVQFDSSTGAFIGGEQDYNDGFGITSADTFSASSPGFSSTVFTTGQGTLTLISSNTAEGVGGTETFAVQLVNSSHLLITQFDGSATSSGSMDLQTATTSSKMSYSFTMSGVDLGYYPVGYGGVFTLASGGAVSGTADVNDGGLNAGAGGLVTGQTFSGTATATDSFGRGTVTGVSINGAALSLVSYVVGPEVTRLMDNDTGFGTGTGNAMVGSAYGQGSGTFNNASIGASVLALQGNSLGTLYATLGQFTTSNTGNATADLAGVGDDNEPAGAVLDVASTFTGTYSLTSAYGAASGISGLGDVTTLGVYMTDPTLNLMDPNNTTTDLGGALVLDQDIILAGGTGVIIPQTDTTAADFNGTYAAGWQNFNDYLGNCPYGCEWDMVSEGSMTSGGALSLTGMDSDPFGSLSATSTPGLSSGDTFTSTPQADTTNVGRWSMLKTNTTPNPLAIVVNTSETGNLNMDIYQASATQLFWIELDTAGVALGPLEGSSAPSKALFKGKPAAKAEAKTNARQRR